MTSALSQPLRSLPDPLPIPVARAAFHASIRPPGSKSLTNRAILLAALAGGRSVIRAPLLDADDAERMLAAVARLGARVERTDGGDLAVEGVGARWAPAPGDLTLDLGNAGTATRFLAAAALLSPAPVVIDGDARMRQRPIGELIDALALLGARAEYLAAPRCPPVRITPPHSLASGSTLILPTTLSSQVISALLLVAPFLPGGLTLRLEGRITSRAYVHMTVALLDRLGASVRTSDGLRVIRVAGNPLPPFDYAVEPDASGATYFWAAGALVPGASVRIAGLPQDSLQGDAGFPVLLERMGARLAFDDDSVTVRAPRRLAPVMADMADMPDAAMTLAAVASFAGGPSVLRGLRTLRLKESDRLAALQAELARVGVDVRVHDADDALTLTPPAGGLDCSPSASPVTFDTYADHRMAMSLALIGLRRPNIAVRDPACVAKTYPTFWSDLANTLGAR